MAVTSITQLFQSFVSGFRLVDGGELNQLVKLDFSCSAGLTALAGGGQAGATPLPSAINEIATVATANDSVALPPAIPGLSVIVINDGANSVQVFGQVSNASNGGAGDTIAPANSVTQSPTATGVTQASAKAAAYYCFALGKWKQSLSA